jgi:hypothetical protein
VALGRERSSQVSSKVMAASSDVGVVEATGVPRPRDLCRRAPVGIVAANAARRLTPVSPRAA